MPDGKCQVNFERGNWVERRSWEIRCSRTLRTFAQRFRERLPGRKKVMATRENIKWLKKNLHTCRLYLNKLSELLANLENFINVKLDITNRTCGEKKMSTSNDIS